MYDEMLFVCRLWNYSIDYRVDGDLAMSTRSHTDTMRFTSICSNFILSLLLLLLTSSFQILFFSCLRTTYVIAAQLTIRCDI